MLGGGLTGKNTSEGIDWEGITGGLLGGLGSYGLGKKQREAEEALGKEILSRGQALGTQAVEGSRFQPFSVTSNLGGVQGTAEGGFDMTLSPEQQAMQDRLFGMSGGFLDELGGDPLERQKALYEQLRAIQSPEEERQRLALEERLLGQGRLGLMTDRYGGSPEQFAQSLAQEQARNEAFYNAYGQSQADRQQAFGLASGLMGLGYMPQQELTKLVQTATPLAGFAQSGRETGATLQADIEKQALASYLESKGLSNEMAQSQAEGMLGGVLGVAGTAIGGPIGGAIGSALGGLFG
jgi:hypothetical protein|tara:strand:+ start:402 stop:1286 length:885 start_codon:yes stop_codon:yes gene_type:complete